MQDLKILEEVLEDFVGGCDLIHNEVIRLQKELAIARNKCQRIRNLIKKLKVK